MKGYLDAVNRAIKVHCRLTGVSYRRLALELGITVGTFVSKVNGHRVWRVDELYTLAQLGFPIPPFTSATRKA